MSWARVDDGLWEHPKFEALRASGRHDAIALWILAISYCGRKGNPRFTIAEAAMLLMCDLDAAESATEVLASRGLADLDSASVLLAKHNRSYALHDWENYRSKNLAKVRAGSQGGRKKAENRRSSGLAESKQSSSIILADAQQTSSPDPETRDPIPLPDPERETLSFLEISELGIAQGWPRLTGEHEKTIASFCPIDAADFAQAMGDTLAKAAKPGWGYLAGTLEGMATRAKMPKRALRRTAPDDDWTPPYLRPENDFRRKKAASGS